MLRRAALVGLICSGGLSFSSDTIALAEIGPAATPCPSGAIARLFYFRQAQSSPSIFRLPLERPHDGAALRKTVFAITARGEAIPLTFQKVFARSPDAAKKCAAQSPEGPEFGDEENEIVSACERGTAQYVAETASTAGIAFLSHDASDKSRIYTTKEIGDPSLRVRIERRLRLGTQHGLTLSEDTAGACGDKPTVRTFRFEAKGGSFAYYESDCTAWGGDGTYGARFVALYKEEGTALLPVFSTRQFADKFLTCRP